MQLNVVLFSDGFPIAFLVTFDCIFERLSLRFGPGFAAIDAGIVDARVSAPEMPALVAAAALHLSEQQISANTHSMDAFIGQIQ